MLDQEEQLAIDESNRVARHGAIKSEVRRDIQADIARQAQPSDEADHHKAAAIAGNLKDKALSEVAVAENELDRARSAARVSQVLDYIFYVIYGLIGLEIFLELLGARDSNSFKRLIDVLTAPLLAPFRTLMPDLSQGRFQLRVSYIVALFVYLLLHLGINGLLRIMVKRKTAV